MACIVLEDDLFNWNVAVLAYQRRQEVVGDTRLEDSCYLVNDSHVIMLPFLKSEGQGLICHFGWGICRTIFLCSPSPGKINYDAPSGAWGDSGKALLG